MDEPGGNAGAIRARRVGIGVVLVLLGGLAWVVLRPHELVFEGQPLSWILSQADMSVGRRFGQAEPPFFEAARKRAERAIRALGPRALPTLVKMAGTRVFGFRMVVGALAAAPELSFLHLPPQLGKHETAVWGFGLLGKEARPAVPALSRLLGDKDPEVRATAARCLAVITPRGPEGVPAMIGLLRDRDPQVQAAAAAWLAEIGPAAAEAVPALVRVVMDRNGMATNQWFVGHAIEQAARALGAIGPAAKAAVPALEEVTNDLRLTRSEPAAAVALVKINQGSWQPFFDRLKDTSDAQRWARTADQVSRLGAEAEPAIRLLLGGLRQTNQVILGGAITAIERLHRRPDLCLGPLISHLSPADPNRGKVLLTLGKFGLEARPAAREVARCLRDRERTIREAATNVLRQIDPDAPDLKPKRP